MEHNLIYIDIKKKLLSNSGSITLNICTDVPLGNLTALFGPSGSGKTTLLRILTGLLTPDEGSIRFGNEIWFDSKSKINLVPQKRKVGMMFQDYALFPNMTVEENINFAMNEHNHSYLSELLEAFDLTEFSKRKPANLSGGQKQRVALARALARKPQLLLLDEPLSALDSEMRSALQDEITRAHEMLHATTILVSHDLHEIFRLASNVVCIDDGTISAKGKPEDVFSDTSISGKFKVIGQIASIVQEDVVNIVTIVTGNNNVVKVIALENDLDGLSEGDRVQVSSKAFNPIIRRI